MNVRLFTHGRLRRESSVGRRGLTRTCTRDSATPVTVQPRGRLCAGDRQRIVREKRRISAPLPGRPVVRVTTYGEWSGVDCEWTSRPPPFRLIWCGLARPGRLARVLPQLDPGAKEQHADY